MTSLQNRQIFLYFAPLTVLIYLTLPENLLDIPTSYILKNHLQATAQQVSLFRLLTGVPLYVVFMPGVARDLWNPLGRRDRGFFLIFGALTALFYVWLALSPLSYKRLLCGMFLAFLSFQFIVAAYQGLIAAKGQHTMMTGRLSALYLVFSYIPLVLAVFSTGLISEYLSAGQVFFVGAAMMLLIALFSIWNPKAVFDKEYEIHRATGAALWEEIKRLLKDRAIYPAVVINWLWFFIPGANTPLQFYLTNHLHTSDATYSYYFAIFLASSIPTYLVYGFLCTRYAPNKLLWWGTAIGLPSMVPLVFVHSGTQALAVAVPMGLTSGIASAAYYDLAMRSCPPRLHGTLMTLVGAGCLVTERGGDVLGSAVYAASPDHGFLYCVILTTAVYVLIFPLILLVPRGLIATPDGQPNAAMAEL
jgi:Na+/melibiose symporter-like transporter